MSRVRKPDNTDRWMVLAAYAALLAATYREVVGHSTIAFIGSYNFTTAEPVLFLLVAALLHAMTRTRLVFSIASAAALLFAGLIAYGVLRGLTVDPFQSIISLRMTGALAVSVALAAFPFQHEATMRKIVGAVSLSSLALVALLILRMIYGPTLFYQADYLTELEINDGGRGLSAIGSTIIAVAAVLTLSSVLRGARTRTVTPRQIATLAVFVVGLLLSRQATATIAGLSGLAATLLLEQGPALLLRRFLLLGAAAILAVIFLMSPDPIGFLSSLVPDWIRGDLSRRANNLETRQLVWTGFMTDYARWSIVERLVGLPAGVKPSIVLLRGSGAYWQFSIHSMYYGTLLYGGLVGLIAYVVMLLSLLSRGLRNLRRSVPAGNLSAAAALGMATVIVVFGVSYEVRNELALLLVLGIVAVGQLQAKERAASSQVSADGHAVNAAPAPAASH